MPDRVATHVDARAAQAFPAGPVSRRETAAVAVGARFGAEQPQRLGDRAAFGLQVVGAPQDHRHRLRQLPAVSLVAGEQAVGLLGAVAHGEGAGDAERIEAVQIAAGGQHVGGAQQIATGSGPDVAAIERMNDGRNFVIDRQQRVEALAFGRIGDAGGIQHRDALFGVEALADDVQARAGSACIPVPAVRPRGPAACESSVQAGSSGVARLTVTAWAWTSSVRACRCAGIGIRGQGAPAVQRRLQIQQSAIQPGMGDRRASGS